jgi:N-acetylmuramoyl-L-alanine amidase
VLYRATMPAILVEAGFLSNAREEAYLASAEGQDHIASAIFRHFAIIKPSKTDCCLLGSATPGTTY